MADSRTRVRNIKAKPGDPGVLIRPESNEVLNTKQNKQTQWWEYI